VRSTYCTAQTNSLGCTPALVTTGIRQRVELGALPRSAPNTCSIKGTGGLF
jgi:hypothetical protein